MKIDQANRTTVVLRRRRYRTGDNWTLAFLYDKVIFDCKAGRGKELPGGVVEILRSIGRLCAIERQIHETQASPEEVLRLQARARTMLQKSCPKRLDLLQHLRQKTPLRKALDCTLRRWDKLLHFTERPYLEIDNNAIENAIRPVAVGRKYYLFAGSHKSAEIIAQIYSIMSACKILGAISAEWLADVLIRLPATQPSECPSFFPSNCRPVTDLFEGLSEEYFYEENE